MSDQISNVSSNNLDTISNAAFCGHLQAFKYLFITSDSENYKQSTQNDHYYLAHNAAATGNLNLLQWTLKNTKCKVTDQDVEGLTILHVASLTSNFNIVEWMLKNTHLSPIIRTQEGTTALHFACWSGNLDITKLLIEAEPRLINMRMSNGATAAMYATQGGFIDIMELLLNEGGNFGLPTANGVNCLHMAAQQGHLEAVKWLVDNTGLRLSGKDDNGISAIHYAAIHNHHDVVSWLLEKEVMLLKERFLIDFNTPVTISESPKSIEELLNSQSNLSIKSICNFSTLELVQKKVTAILSEFDQSDSQMETAIDGLLQCCIPINVLLLLQSALSDLRLQYQRFLRQSYLSSTLNETEKISEETQTIEVTENSEISKENILFKIEAEKMDRENKSEISNQEPNYVPPPPPLVTPLPPINTASDSPTVASKNNYQKRISGKKAGLHRRGSSSDDIKISLIQELKLLNTMRSLNSQSMYVTEDNDSGTSNSSSLTSSSLNTKNISRKIITDSAPNLQAIFSPNINNSSNLLTPKRNVDATNTQLNNKNKFAFLGDNAVQLKEIPDWKRQIIENRAYGAHKSKKEILKPTPSPIEAVESMRPKASSVTQLINQWQNSNT